LVGAVALAGSDHTRDHHRNGGRELDGS